MNLHEALLASYVNASNHWHALSENAETLRKDLARYPGEYSAVQENLDYQVHHAWKEVEKTLTALEAFNIDTNFEHYTE